MRCDRALELFSDYCDGTLSGPLAVTFQSHLDACEVCRTQVGELREIWTDLSAGPEVDPPANFRATIWHRIEAAETSRQAVPKAPSWSWRMLFTRPAFGLATAAMVLIVLGSVVIPGPHSQGWIFGVIAPHATQDQVLVVGTPHVEQTPAGQVLVVNLRTTGERPLAARVAVIGESGVANAALTPAGTEVRVPLSAASVPNARLRVEWSADGRAVHREIVVSLAQ